METIAQPLVAERHMPAVGGPKFLNERAETMSRQDIVSTQEAQLLRAIRFAYDNAPLIHTTWEAAGLKPDDIKSLAEFKARAPFISKDKVRAWRDAHNDPTGGLRAVPESAVYRVTTSSGTTGDPTPEFKGFEDLGDEWMTRDMWHMGLRPGDYVVFPLFTFRTGVTPFVYANTGIIPITFAHSPLEVPRIIAASRQFRPVAAYTVSNPLISAFEIEFERSGIDPVEVFKSYRGAVFGGELLSRRQRALTASWGLELYEITAAGDIGAAIDCSMHAGCHIWEDTGFYECLDPDGDRPVADGEVGELVVTSFNPYNPLIRSRSDDLITMDTAPCACGRTHARIKTLGRKGDKTSVNGKPILPRHVHELIETHAPTRGALYQIIRTAPEMDVLRLRVGYNPALLTGTLEKLIGELTDHLSAELDIPVRIEMTLDAELLKLGPPHKIPRVAKS